MAPIAACFLAPVMFAFSPHSSQQKSPRRGLLFHVILVWLFCVFDLLCLRLGSFWAPVEVKIVDRRNQRKEPGGLPGFIVCFRVQDLIVFWPAASAFGLLSGARSCSLPRPGCPNKKSPTKGLYLFGCGGLITPRFEIPDISHARTSPGLAKELTHSSTV